MDDRTDLSFGDFAESLDELEFEIALEVREVSHGLVDHLLGRLSQLAVFLGEGGELEVELVVLLQFVQDRYRRDEHFRCRSEIGGLRARIGHVRERSSARGGKRLRFSSVSPARRASLALPGASPTVARGVSTSYERGGATTDRSERFRARNDLIRIESVSAHRDDAEGGGVPPRTPW